MFVFNYVKSGVWRGNGQDVLAGLYYWSLRSMTHFYNPVKTDFKAHIDNFSHV